MPNFLNYTYFGAEGVCEISAVPYLDVFDISLESLFLSFSQQMMQNGVGLEVGTFPSFSSLNLPSVPSFQSPLVIGLVVSGLEPGSAAADCLLARLIVYL